MLTPEHLTEYLAFLRRTATAIEELEFRTVQVLREAGVSWTVIATALDISRQTASERYGGPRRPQRTKRKP